MTRPNFIYVGAPKAGSSWLFQALSDHPDVFVSPEKSTTYFETAEARPIEEYVARFEGAGAAKAVGEIAHDTFLDPDAARRIHAAFPEMKILCCLREPGDFARSAIQWWAAHTTRYGETPDAMLRHERLGRLLDYPARIAPFMEVFPRDQVKVFFFDDLKRNPEAFLEDVFDFLEVDAGFRPAVLGRLVNPASRARFQGLTHFAYATGGVLRALGFGKFVEYVKQRSITDKLLYKALASEPASETKALIQEIRKKAQPGLARLESLINEPVPPGWRQP
jgi:hypothetical protein